MEIATFIGPVYAQARYVAAMAAMAVSFGASAATPFTFNPPAAGLNGSSFTASSLIVSDYATVTHSFSSGANPQLTGFSETGFLSVVAARLNGNTAPTTGLNSTYGLYIDFSAAGTVTTLANDFYRGNITQLTYTLFGYNGTATFSPSGNSVPTGSLIALGSGSLVAGTGSFNGELDGGLVNAAFAKANLTFTPNANAVAFFPFSGIVQATFGNSSDQITNTSTGFTVAGGGGSINFLSVTPVPEPETYAMLIAGLGLVGFVASRRGRKQAR